MRYHNRYMSYQEHPSTAMKRDVLGNYLYLGYAIAPIPVGSVQFFRIVGDATETLYSSLELARKTIEGFRTQEGQGSDPTAR